MFDPFGDGRAVYLRNLEGLSDREEVKRAEHFHFTDNLEDALAFLQSRSGALGYEHFLEVHKILFQNFYPWAGQDRAVLQVGRLVGRGEEIQFEASELCRRAAEWGLRLGNDKALIRARPGEVMGALAWAHPFLDGNGRTMLLVHNELCHRADFSIDWTRSTKDGYLDALTHELQKPQDRFLDTYLLGLVGQPTPHRDWVAQFKAMPGLAGVGVLEADVSYRADDAVANARYEEVKRLRGTSGAAGEARIA